MANLNWIKIASVLILSASVAMGAPKKMMMISLILGIVAFILDKDRLIYIKESCFYKTFFNIIILVGGLVLYAKYTHNEDGARFIVKYFDLLIPLVIVWIFIGRFSESIKYSLIGLGIGNIINSVYAIFNWAEKGGRVGGYFGGPNDLGGILLVLTPFFLYGVYEYWKKGLAHFCGINLLLVLLCLVISYCRGAIIGISYEMLGFIILNYYIRKFAFISLKHVLILILGIIGLPILVAFLAARSYDYERVLLWIAGYQMFADYTLFGVGLTNFNDVYNKAYISPLAKEPYLTHPHNALLLILSECGLLGFVLFMNLIVDIIKKALNHIRAYDLERHKLSVVSIFLLALLGVAVHAQVDSTPLWRPIRTAMIFLWSITCTYMCNRKHIEI